MKIGFIGLGKLGFPVALVMARKHDVVGYDISQAPRDILARRKYPHQEVLVDEYIASTSLRMVDTMADAVAHADVIFVAVQTPHKPEFEGATRLPEERADFDYSYLKDAVRVLAEEAAARRKKIILVVISTVLPGTVNREVRPLLNEWTAFCYSPLFIAMGTVIPDYLKPEFVLLGRDGGDEDAADVVREFYGTIHNAEVVEMSVASAEATKVAYNSFISMKLGLVNTWMQICEETGANVDDVTLALGKATDRIVSTKYMRAGMGDGGGCHPRDNIALSWVSRRLGMKYDFFGDVMRSREMQTEWLADVALRHAERTGLPIVVLGRSFKAGTNIATGSAAVLLANILRERTKHVDQWDPHFDPPRAFDHRAVFVVAAAHPEFFSMSFPHGSVVVDPWGRTKDVPGIEVVRVGRR